MKKPFLLLLLFLGSCQKRSMDSLSMFSKSGDLKDKIALTKMVDSSAKTHLWDITTELSSYLEKDIARKDTLYVIPVDDEVKLSSLKNPFSKKLDWLDHHFPHTKYIAFTELLKYEDSSESDPTLGHSLDVSVRIRVFEKQADGFKIVLQEIIQESYMIPSLFSKTLSIQPSYNSPGYELSPVGVAHQNLSRQIAKRIREYIK